jgi:hypothetical protein
MEEKEAKEKRNSLSFFLLSSLSSKSYLATNFYQKPESFFDRFSDTVSINEGS